MSSNFESNMNFFSSSRAWYRVLGLYGMYLKPLNILPLFLQAQIHSYCHKLPYSFPLKIAIRNFYLFIGKTLHNVFQVHPCCRPKGYLLSENEKINLASSFVCMKIRLIERNALPQRADRLCCKNLIKLKSAIKCNSTF